MKRIGFPVLTKVHPTPPLRTQIPMDLQRNCWIVAINSQHRGRIEPITAIFCLDEITKCQVPNDASKNQASIDGATVTSYDVRPNRSNAAHRDAQVAISQRPREEQSIFAALKGPNRQVWIQ